MGVDSTWGDWLVRAIEDATPDGIAVWYLGCNGFVLKTTGGTTVFIDPYLGTGDPPRTVRMIPVPFDPADVRTVDAVLATHEHTDHVHAPSQAPILAASGAVFYGPDDSIAVTVDEDWRGEWNLEADQFAEITEGDTFDIGDLSVTVVATHDPDATHPVGYVLEHAAGTVYHGGDTKPHETLTETGEAFDLDLGILAFGSTGLILDKHTRTPKLTAWYADENAVIRAANALELSCLVPAHWDMWKGLTADPTGLIPHARSFPFPERIEILEIGDRINLPL